MKVKKDSESGTVDVELEAGDECRVCKKVCSALADGGDRRQPLFPPEAVCSCTCSDGPVRCRNCRAADESLQSDEGYGL